MQFKNQSKIMITFYEKATEDIEVLLKRMLGIFLKYPNEKIGEYFSQKENQKDFRAFLENMNLENYKIAEFDGNMPETSFSMYIEFFVWKISDF